MLYANCSESTVRLNISKLSEEEIDKLQKELMAFIIERQNEDELNKRLEIKNKSLNEVTADFDSLTYETYLSISEIWGIKTLTVHGDFPFNNSEDMNAFIDEHKLESEIEEE